MDARISTIRQLLTEAGMLLEDSSIDALILKEGVGLATRISALECRIAVAISLVKAARVLHRLSALHDD